MTQPDRKPSQPGEAEAPPSQTKTTKEAERRRRWRRAHKAELKAAALPAPTPPSSATPKDWPPSSAWNCGNASPT